MVTSTDHDTGEDGPEIVRRKYSMPEKTADKIQALAIEHYGGNQSLFVRSATADHAYTLKGRGRRLIQETLDEIKNVGEAVDRLQENLNASNSGSKGSSSARIVGSSSENTVEDTVSDRNAIHGDMWPVYRGLADAYPVALSIDDLASSRNLSKVAIRHALIDLRDRGKIMSNGGERMVKYEITTDESV